MLRLRALLQLLDGTRDRAALLDDLVAFVVSGGAVVHKDGEPVKEPKAVRQLFAAELARLALCVE